MKENRALFRTTAWAALAVGVLCIALSPNVAATEWNQQTYFTFNQPVAIPGVVLPAGSYDFQLASPSWDRNLIQIFNRDRTKLYATVFTVPDYRLKVRGKPVITFEEGPAGAPVSIRSWFYPGDEYGHQFTYPKWQEQEMSKLRSTHVGQMKGQIGQ